MSRSIDSDKLVKRLKADPLYSLVEQYGITRVIENEPTADVAEIKRGRWERCDFSAPSGGYTMYQCSVCACLYYEPSHYCPNCGARMVDVDEVEE